MLVLDGLHNASAYSKSIIQLLFVKIKHNVKALINDFVSYKPSKAELLKYLDELFTICCSHSINLSATKSVFYSRKAKLCGRIIDGKRHKLKPLNKEALLTVDPPITAKESGQIIQVCR